MSNDAIKNKMKKYVSTWHFHLKSIAYQRCQNIRPWWLCFEISSSYKWASSATFHLNMFQFKMEYSTLKLEKWNRNLHSTEQKSLLVLLRAKIDFLFGCAHCRFLWYAKFNLVAIFSCQNHPVANISVLSFVWIFLVCVNNLWTNVWYNKFLIKISSFFRFQQFIEWQKKMCSVLINKKNDWMLVYTECISNKKNMISQLRLWSRLRVASLSQN